MAVCNVDDLDFRIVGPACQIGLLAHPSVVKEKKRIMIVRLLLDLTFAREQLRCSYNHGVISHGPRILHRVICAILHSPRILRSMKCAISHSRRILHEGNTSTLVS